MVLLNFVVIACGTAALAAPFSQLSAPSHHVSSSTLQRRSPSASSLWLPTRKDVQDAINFLESDLVETEKNPFATSPFGNKKQARSDKYYPGKRDNALVKLTSAVESQSSDGARAFVEEGTARVAADALDDYVGKLEVLAANAKPSKETSTRWLYEARGALYKAHEIDNKVTKKAVPALEAYIKRLEDPNSDDLLPERSEWVTTAREALESVNHAEKKAKEIVQGVEVSMAEETLAEAEAQGVAAVGDEKVNRAVEVLREASSLEHAAGTDVRLAAMFALKGWENRDSEPSPARRAVTSLIEALTEDMKKLNADAHISEHYCTQLEKKLREMQQLITKWSGGKGAGMSEEEKLAYSRAASFYKSYELFFKNILQEYYGTGGYVAYFQKQRAGKILGLINKVKTTAVKSNAATSGWFMGLP